VDKGEIKMAEKDVEEERAIKKQKEIAEAFASASERMAGIVEKKTNGPATQISLINGGKGKGFVISVDDDIKVEELTMEDIEKAGLFVDAGRYANYVAAFKDKFSTSRQKEIILNSVSVKYAFETAEVASAKLGHRYPDCMIKTDSATLRAFGGSVTYDEIPLESPAPHAEDFTADRLRKSLNKAIMNTSTSLGWFSHDYYRTIETKDEVPSYLK